MGCPIIFSKLITEPGQPQDKPENTEDKNETTPPAIIV